MQVSSRDRLVVELDLYYNYPLEQGVDVEARLRKQYYLVTVLRKTQ